MRLLRTRPKSGTEAEVAYGVLEEEFDDDFGDEEAIEVLMEILDIDCEAANDLIDELYRHGHLKV